MKIPSKRSVFALPAICLVCSLACNKDKDRALPNDDLVETSTGRQPSPGDRGVKEAEVDIEAAEGKKIDGEAELTATASGVRIVVHVKDAPAGSKGIHIHEKGDCSNIAGKSMGEHFAPEGHNHALPDEGARHLGDLGNIIVGSDGKGELDITVEGANLREGDPKSFLGKALVIHEDVDKGSAEQPSGGSAAPMACGIVKKD